VLFYRALGLLGGYPTQARYPDVPLPFLCAGEASHQWFAFSGKGTGKGDTTLPQDRILKFNRLDLEGLPTHRPHLLSERVVGLHKHQIET